MDGDFFRFPHTPHLAWLGRDTPRDDKVLSTAEVQALLAGDVVVEEKLDGSNLGLSLAREGGLRAQNRGQYLGEPHAGQFARLPAWWAQHGEALRSVLMPDLVVFGEWCAARHSLDYAALPDWFLVFDVYDRTSRRFWSSSRRNALALSAGLATVPLVARGRCSIAALKELVTTCVSHYRQGPMEGVVVRRESSEWCETRAKLVRADFTQSIDTHWRRRVIEWNRVDAHVPLATR
ncbi:MAG: RNA ligase family protein [Burkholderiales bacterium]|jgi:ATP-dependent RNA circularization protein (DNA/RNA ligase family)|nr:RNA ligase family protein [Burkholderiales bacterium]MBP7520053.1 RNA ligase family protein [Leptothrix sp. (in: b-proteobacteria)]HQY07493.1 RNA ligase family protein [Burkholderiaceae bacterium]